MNTTISVNYEKRKNNILFDKCKTDDFFNLDEIQNFNPIYKYFFELSNKNFNSVNLNHSKYIFDIHKNTENDNIEFIIKENELTYIQDVFIKQAPILDPFKYLLGKYNLENYSLPTIEMTESNIVSDKINDMNNSAYVDGLFYYLSSQLSEKFNFKHGIEFYGSFLAIKNNFKINIEDDIEYLLKSDYFNSNKHLFLLENDGSLPLLTIDNSTEHNLTASTINDELFEGVFVDDNKEEEFKSLEEIEITVQSSSCSSVNSSSTCSSRTSFTTVSEAGDDESQEGSDEESGSEGSEDEGSDYESGDEGSGSYSSHNDNPIYATLPKFHVNLIFMEKCVNTMDNLILKKEFKSDDEWFSCLFQIIMILITFQKCFSFTHNDLHTNNIMYVHTNEQYLFYHYNKKYYKVPTYGRIFKIIDFGRSIYKINNHLICSDSFKKGEDAATQYNIEPYLNPNKPRVEPNYSFDLCRLACSIFDYLIDDIRDVKHMDKLSPLVKLIVEWCLDDNKLNVLYKSNGAERYEEFKLYKMIARSVHNHIPHKQLDRKIFSSFSVKKIFKENKSKVIDIDSIPVF
jgi:hypothetical protein